MISLIRKYRLIIYILLIPYIFIIVSTTYRVNYSISTPGGISQVSSAIDITDAYPSSGAFYTVYVQSFYRPTIFQVWVGNQIDYANVYEIPEGTIIPTDKETFEIGQFTYDLALQKAIIYAYNESNSIINYDFEGLVVYGISNFNTNEDLELFDRIRIFDNYTINNYADFSAVLGNYTCGDLVDVTLERANGDIINTVFEMLEVNGYCKFGILVTDNYVINDATPSFELANSYVSGPSGGLLRTLSIYNDLVVDDITHGLKIAGTGTINIDGSVGYIGSVKQKVVGAIREGVDIFFVPHLSDEDYDDYIEALEVYNQFDTDMILVGVSSFSEALDYLEGLDD